MPIEQNLLQTSGARAMFWAFNDSSGARLILDLAKEVGDVSAAAEIERRLQHEEWRQQNAAICHDRVTVNTKENEPYIHGLSK